MLQKALYPSLYCGKWLLSIRTISITPPGFSTSQILSFLTPYTIKEIAEVNEAADYEGKIIRIFLDVYDFLGKNPVSSQAVAVMKHNTGAPCTHCTICHQKKFCLPDCTYTFAVCYGQPSSTRALLRSLSLSFLGMSGSDTQYLQMKYSKVQTTNDLTWWPLLQLAVKLNKVKHLIKDVSQATEFS